MSDRVPLADCLLAAYARRGWRGFRTLWRLAGRAPGDFLRVRTVHGIRLDLDPWAYIDRVVLQSGYYESEVLEAIVAALPVDGVFWDVGANFGLHALTTKCRMPGARVICFEPSPGILGQLWRHRAINGLDITVNTTALSDRAGFQTLHVAGSGNAGMTTLAPWAQANYESAVLVATARGDDLAAAGHLPPPHVIKLDVEGHEAAVLRGLENTLRSGACRAVVFEDAPDEQTMPKQLLRDAGFRLRPLSRREATAHALLNFVAERP